MTARVRDSVSHQNFLSSFRRAKYAEIGHARYPMKLVIGSCPYMGWTAACERLPAARIYDSEIRLVFS